MKISIRLLLVIIAVFQYISLRAQGTIDPESSSKDTITSNSKIETGLTYTNGEDKTLFSTKIDFPRLRFTNELSVFDILQGKISGLDIISASGNPGRNSQAILRGQNSPLIVINGIPQKSHDDLFNAFNFYGEDIRSMIPVSVEDIKSVEVLKDGSATALYGADGADGVILIETKKGSRQKMGLTYQFNQSIVNEPSSIPMLNGNEYSSYQLEALHNYYNIFEVPDEISYNRDNPNYYNYSANTNWQKAVTQMGYASNHCLNIFGGNEKNRYYGSVNYLDQKGTIINTGYQRLLSRLNFEHYFTKKLTLAINLNYTNSKYNENVIPEDDAGNSGKNILEMAFIKAPNMSIWKYDAKGNRTGEYFTPSQNYQGSGFYYYNPVAVSESGNSTSTFNELTTTAYLHYDFKSWLKFRESFSYNRYTAVSKASLPISAISSDLFNVGSDLNSKSDMGFEQFRNEIQTLIKIPFKDEKKNMLNGTFTWIRQNEKYQEYRIETDKKNILINVPEKNRNAAVSSVYYKLLDRYMLNVNTRIESVSIDSQDKNKWDNHYSISTGWRFSGESFIKKLKFLDEGIIHLGWSSSKYQSLDNGMIFTELGSSIYQSPVDFSSNSFNNNCEVKIYNLGIELGLFHDRLHLTSDYYSRKNSYGSDPTAIFKVQNKGWEFMVDYSLIRKENLDWTVQFNMAHNIQMFLELPDNISSSSTMSNGNYVSYISENESPGSIYGLLYEGVYSTDQDAVALDRGGNVLVDGSGTPIKLSYKGIYTFEGGDAKYKDMNNDGLIDEKDLVYLGNSNPKVTGGFGSTIRFKNLSLTCNFHYRSGYKIINQVAMDSEGLSYINNQSKNELNRWMVDGQQGTDLLPRAYRNHPANNLGSDRYVENGGYIRMNYISLGYQIKPEFCQKLKIKELFLSLSAQRLLTFSNYSGLDPETEKRNNDLLSFNKDEIRVIPPKIFTISIRITV